MSRLLPSNTQEGIDGTDHYIRFVVTRATSRAVSTRDIEQESANDKELTSVRACVMNNSWIKGELPEFKAINEELCCLGKLTLRGTRLVIPQALREQVLEIAHEGHPGIVQMKQRLRTKVWWPKIDSDAEKFCRSCHGCQTVSRSSLEHCTVNGFLYRPLPACKFFSPPRPRYRTLRKTFYRPLPSSQKFLPSPPHSPPIRYCIKLVYMLNISSVHFSVKQKGLNMTPWSIKKG